jgi:hypothetical protein
VKSINASPSKEVWLSQYMWYTSLSQILIIVMKSQTKTPSFVLEIKECTTFNGGMTVFNPNNVLI